ncbi:xanthine dehydrogenase family protein molybdopterin-binding subunit [Kribbella sp. ALI-6-A]|uniref:xanthine dehydrogenase family protein molybdopterin-binding subunit n=1 Tax=Kribbella sp. ALI-6-A TaxID=1933817 RepID=UPI000A050721|nr:xanthine dehydrogenase family protein molybdopterin-binding subunit [Kribbella sp. ALI-6-A]
MPTRRNFLRGAGAATALVGVETVGSPLTAAALAGDETLRQPYARRVDARDKVRGAVQYGADHVPARLTHAVPVVATIGKGRVVEFDTTAAEAVPGVRLVLTRIPPGELRSAPFIMAGGFAVQGYQPMTSDRVAYRGQMIALVVADTLVAATEAAALVTARYETEPFAVTLDADGTETLLQATVIPRFPDTVMGDADAAYATSPVKLDATYDGPPQHAMPIELLASTVEWQGENLIVRESTQNANAVRHGVAYELGISADRVEVISPSAGGAFGQKNSFQMHLGPLALAARRVGRPVKLVVPRTQTFHAGSFRPASRQRIRLGADRSGRMLAAIHEIDAQTSRHDLFPMQYTELTGRMYDIPDFRGRHQLVRTDAQTPGYMRAPFEHIAAFALESSVDELAYKLGKDPVALRLANDAPTTDPISGHPFTSRHLAECLRRGADRFGWVDRRPGVGSMRAKDGTLIGWGVAVGAYKAATAPATAVLRAESLGRRRCRVTITVDGHEMGQGIRTAITNLITGNLGVATEDVVVVVGDTRGVPPQHSTAGSWGTATALPAIDAAMGKLREQLGLRPSGPIDLPAAMSGRAPVELQARTKAPGQPDDVWDRVAAGGAAGAGPEYPAFTSMSYIAHFVEVRIEPRIRRIRVPRVVSVADCGRVASPVTAVSQVRGGVIWGIGATLREGGEVDPRFGGFLSASLEDYALPVNADIGDIDVSLIDKPDPLLNSVGVKSLGEVSMVGVAPAIANAVWHATGRRVRRLPIRIEDVI